MAWPTTKNPKTEFVTIRFTKDEADELDAAVSSMSAASRSAYLRDCARRCIKADKRKTGKK